MYYKRAESFRYTFGEPCEATFTLAATEQREESHKGDCLLIDISPSGAKIFSKLSVPIKTSVMLYFVLYKKN